MSDNPQTEVEISNDSGSPAPVSATSWPLPTGAATSALQTTGNSSLSSIDSKTPALVGGRQPVDGSGVTQPISAVSLPLPTGAATSSLQTTGNTSLSSIDSKTPALVGGRQPVDGSGVTQPISAVSLPLPTGAATAANQSSELVLIGAVNETAPGTDTASSGLNGRLQRIAQNITNLNTSVAAPSVAVSTGDSTPVPSGYQQISDPYAVTTLQTDYYGNLNVRGQVLTDEGSFRDDFSGSGLTSTLTGTLTFTASGQTVTGSGTLFTQELSTESYIKKTTDADALFVQVLQIISDTQLLLADPYGGTTGSSAATLSSWIRVLGGGTANVANSIVSIASSTNANGKTYLQRAGDYGPMSLIVLASVSQRIASQFSVIGFRDAWNNVNVRAEFNFNGTNNTQVQCITATSSAAADIQTTTVTLPGGVTTATAQKYTVDVGIEKVAFSINDEIVAVHFTHIPSSYSVMDVFLGVDNNSVAVSSTTLAVDYAHYKNFDAVQVYSESPGTPVNNSIVGKSPSGNTKIVGVSDDYGALNAPVNTRKASYSASIVGLTAANTATDIFTLTGSATKTIRITKVELSATQTTAAANNIVMLKRSTANTGGTSSTPTAVPLDSTDAAATAVCRAYTANPTAGTLVGNLRAHKLFIPTTTGSPGLLAQKFGENNKEIVLRGTSEVFAINLNSTTIAGNNFDIFIEWTEE